MIVVRLLTPGRLSGLFSGAVFPIALSRNGDRQGGPFEAVDDRFRQDGIRDHFGPVLIGELGGQEHRLPEGAVFQDLPQVLRLVDAQFFQPEIVQLKKC